MRFAGIDVGWSVTLSQWWVNRAKCYVVPALLARMRRAKRICSSCSAHLRVVWLSRVDPCYAAFASELSPAAPGNSATAAPCVVRGSRRAELRIKANSDVT
jgi:hypothetical protein